MIGCLPTLVLAFLAVFVYATHATQVIAFEWKLGFSRLATVAPWLSTSCSWPGILSGQTKTSHILFNTISFAPCPSQTGQGTVGRKRSGGKVQVAPQRDEIFKQKVNDCVQHIILQKFTYFHAVRSWNFRIFAMRWWPRFLRHPVHNSTRE